MDLQTRKIEFIQAFLKLESEKAVSHFEKLLQEVIKTPSDIKPFTMQEFKKRIEQSTEDSKNGRLTENSQLISEIEKWS